MRSDIEVQNVLKLLSDEDKVRSHKTNQSYIRGSFIATNTVSKFLLALSVNDKVVKQWSGDLPLSKLSSSMTAFTAANISLMDSLVIKPDLSMEKTTS